MRRAALLLLVLAACSKGKKSSAGAAGDDLIKSKTTEAKINLNAIRMGLKAAFAEEGTLPPSIPMTPPLGACCQGPDRKCPAEPQLFTAAGWDKVNFSPSEPHYYSYELVSTPTDVTVRAQGDLDCNGVYSSFEMHFSVQAGSLSGGELSITNELE